MSVKEYPVYIVGEVADKEIGKKRNIFMLGKKAYKESFDIIRAYKYALDIEPNFMCGVHDRIIRSADAGTYPVINNNYMRRDIFKNNAVYYRYDDIDDRIERAINSIDEQKYIESVKNLQNIVNNNYSWEVLLNKIITHYKCYKK